MSRARAGRWLLGGSLLSGWLFPAGGNPRPFVAAQSAAGQAEPKPEIETLLRELTARPGWTEGWWQLGTAEYEANRFDVAVPALEHVVSAAPQMGLAWSILGLSQFGSTHFKEARTSLERAASLGNADDPEVEQVAAYHLSLLRIRDGDFADAAKLLRATFGPNPNPQAALALGLAVLHVPLLPTDVDPTREAVLTAVGTAAAQGTNGLQAFAAVTSANPDVPLLHLAYGEALQAAGQQTAALAEFQREVAVSPQSPAAWKALARAEQGAAHAKAARTANDRAVTFTTSEAAERKRSQQWFTLRTAAAKPVDRDEGMQAYAEKNFALAEQKLSAWLAAHPDDGTSWAVLGLSEFALRDFESARLHLERGVSLGLHGDAQAVGEARYTLGLLLLRAGDFDRAATELSAAQKLAGNSDRFETALGFTLLRRASLPDAAADPLAISAGKIESMLLESRYDQAFPAFRALLTKYPHTPFLHYTFGTALMALSEFDEAAAQMQAELTVSPGSALPHEGLASISLRQRSPAAAVSEAQRAVALAPGTAEPHYLLGRALLESGGDPGASVRELQQAAQLNPNSPEVHFSLAKAYARAAEPAKAAQERTTFARLQELSEAERSGQGPQTYSGPREEGILSSSPDMSKTPQ